MRRWIFCLSLLCAPAWAAPPFAEVKEAYRASDARLLDRNGMLVSELRVNLQGRSLSWVPLKEVSPAFPAALLALEDRHFYSHHGVDWRALAAASWQNLFSQKKRGASTITMQLVSLLGLEGPRLGRRGPVEKVHQAWNALRLEAAWSKGEVMEAYLNLVPFRGEIVGLRAAAMAFFGKGPSGLNEAEALFLGAMIRSPNASARAIARSICAAKQITDCAWWESFADASLAGRRAVFPGERGATHLARMILSSGENSVRSTLDRRLQALATELVADQVRGWKEQNLTDAAVLVLDNRSGDVLAYVGSSGSGSSAPLVDGVRARRQAGSTLKPFLYGLAWERNLLGLHSPLLDTPYEEALARGAYRPKNYDNHYHGEVEAQKALASSLNIPAVKVLGIVGVMPFHQRLLSLGFSNLEESEFYGSSLALGSADISLWDLTNAYRTLANEGLGGPLRLRLDDPVEEGARIFSARAARLVSEALSNPENRVLGFGWDNILTTSFPSAVKTGTSKDMRDNWCVGFTPDYTVGVWVGSFDGSPMHNVTGISGAGPIWRGLMDELHRGKPVKEFAKAESQRLPTLNRRTSFPRIRYPLSGAILAFDPDIPPSRQRIPLESENGSGLLWKINGRLLGAGVDSIPVQKGKFKLALVKRGGDVVDKVEFEIR